jgi:DNA invertase Pin-like site-specific DNA recombinase
MCGVWPSCFSSAASQNARSRSFFVRAELEREVIGERIRDKIAASKKKGMWMGGVPPFGYRAQDRKLVIDESGENPYRRNAGDTGEWGLSVPRHRGQHLRKGVC